MPPLNTSIAIANDATSISTSISSTSISSYFTLLALLFLVILHNASIVLFFSLLLNSSIDISISSIA